MSRPDFEALAKTVEDRQELAKLLEDVYAMGYDRGHNFGWCDAADDYYSFVAGGAANEVDEKKE